MLDRYELKLNVSDKFWFRPTFESEFNTNLFTSSEYEVADVQTHSFAVMVSFYTLCPVQSSPVQSVCFPVL
jgi:hypothetical protein